MLHIYLNFFFSMIQYEDKIINLNNKMFITDNFFHITFIDELKCYIIVFFLFLHTYCKKVSLKGPK